MVPEGEDIPWWMPRVESPDGRLVPVVEWEGMVLALSSIIYDKFFGAVPGLAEELATIWQDWAYVPEPLPA